MSEEKRIGAIVIKPLKRITEAKTNVMENKPEPQAAHSASEPAAPSAPTASAPAASSTGANENKLRTRSQTYAAAVYERVNAVRTRNKEFRENYLGLARKFPALICTAGLAQALSFVSNEAKERPASKQLLDDLNGVIGEANGNSLLTTSLDADLLLYMHLTRKTLSALVWFKRFSESILDTNEPSIKDNALPAEGSASQGK